MICATITILKKYLPSVINSEFSKYEAEVKDANLWLKKEILGKELFEKIDDEDFDDNDLTSLCEAVVARKAYMEGIPGFDLTETSGGFVVTRNEQQAPASPERVKKLQESIAQKVTESIENLLQYLEENSDYHTDWKGSPTYALLTDIYIHTLTEFRRFAPWQASRMAWIAAKPQMINVIKLKIEPVISRELSEEIIEELRDDDLSDSNRTIIENLKFAFANYVTGNTDEGNSYLFRIRKKLMATPDNFPVWKASELYKAILESTINKYNPERKIFRAGF